MSTLYKDIDLDVDPCVCTPCGHIFTIDSLDGTMGMGEHYEIDPLTGKYIGLKTTAEPFSIEDSRPCPDCRGSLRSLARYGRIVRRALLDKSAKKLTAWSNRKHQELANRLVGLEGELMDTLEFKRKPGQNLVLNQSIQSQIGAIKELKTAGRYRKMFNLINEIAHFMQKLCKDEQPYQRVHDLVEMVRRQNKSGNPIAAFEFSSEELQLREHLQAGNLLIRSYLVLLSDAISVHDKTPTGAKRALHVDFTMNRMQREELIGEATASKNLRQEVETKVLWAKFAAMECGVIETDYEHTEVQDQADELRSKASKRLDAVENICAQQAKSSTAYSDLLRREQRNLVSEVQAGPLKYLADEAAEVRRMFKEGMSSSEMRMVVTVMAKEFRGTGHWYRCVHGHPFTVGECGTPMQLARCPECGAGVGGQSHVPTEGVTRAQDIEERFGHLTM